MGCGEESFGGDDSVIVVRGEYPFEAAREFAANLAEFEKTDDAVLVSELAEPTACSISPDSAAVVAAKPFTCAAMDDAPFMSFGALKDASGDMRGCDPVNSLLRFKEVGEEGL